MVNLKKYLKDILQNNKLGMSIMLGLSIVVSVASLFQPLIIQTLIDEGIGKEKVNLLILLSSLYVSSVILINALKYVIVYYHGKVKKRFTYNTKLRILNHIKELSGDFLTNKHTGEILKIFESDIFNLEAVGIDTFIDILINLVTGIIAIRILLLIDYKLFIIVIVLEAIMIVVQKRIVHTVSHKTKILRNVAGVSMSLIESFISNIMNAIITKTDFVFINKYKENEEEVMSQSWKLGNIIEKGQLIANGINELMIILIYTIGGFWIIKGNMTLGLMLAFNQYTALVINPFLQLINSYSKIQNTMVSINKIYDLLNITPIKNDESASLLKEYNIEFRNVEFSYGFEEGLFNKINLKFPQGKTTALVGASGSGKSTIIKLLFRLWNPIRGEIRIGNKSISEYNLNNLRASISVVTQDVHIFNDTVYNNITLGAAVSSEEIMEICKRLDLENFIKSLPEGLNTNMGENGVKMSGGQKQRIAMARALFEDAPILILDEATSALDTNTQNIVMNNISHYLKHKTTIIITHRLSTLKNVDYIYLLGKEGIIEEGTPDMLMNLKGDFYHLAAQGKPE